MKPNCNCFYLLLAMLILTSSIHCTHHAPAVNIVNSEEAVEVIKENISNPAFIILDVRTPGEFTSGHLAGAVNLDYNAVDFELQLDRLDKEKNYLVYCKSRYRSSAAAGMMETKGFKSIKNLDGGISAWMEADLPVVSE